MDQQNTLDGQLPGPTEPRTLWQENHGNLLLGFVAVVFVIGAIILVYRQNRFVPVRFPEANAIDVPADEESLVPVDAASGVTIRVIGAISDLGKIKIAIFDSADSFGQAVDAKLLHNAVLSDGEALWVVSPKDLPERFAIMAYHDENEDDVINRNRLGVSIERYGYSNDVRGTDGPPEFNAAAVTRPAPGSELILTIR